MLVGRATGALHNAGPTWDERSGQGDPAALLVTLPKPLDVIQRTKFAGERFGWGQRRVMRNGLVIAKVVFWPQGPGGVDSVSFLRVPALARRALAGRRAKPQRGDSPLARRLYVDGAGVVTKGQ